MKILSIVFVLLFLVNQSFAEEKKTKAFINIGGYVDGQFAGSSQSSGYSEPYLPNHNTTLPSINRQNTLDSSMYTRTHSRIDLTGGGELENGTKFGATIIMNSVVNQGDDDNGGAFANQNFLFVQTDNGKVQIGSVVSPAATMRMDATSVARATGGIGGDWWRFVNYPTFDTTGLSSSVSNELVSSYAPSFILQPMLPNEAGFTTGLSSSMFIYNGSSQTNPQLVNGKFDAMYFNRQQTRFGWGSTSNKFVYYTPRVSGLQFGFSLSPDSGNFGGVAQSQSSYALNGAGNSVKMGGRTSGASGDVRNIITLGLNYKEQFDNLGVGLSATVEKGQAENISNPYGVNATCTANGSCINGYNGRRDLLAWALGGKLIYGGLSIAGSYGSWGKSLQPYSNLEKDGSGNYKFPWLVPTDSNGNAMDSFGSSGFSNLGIAYGFGPINLSLTGIRSKFAGNKMKAISFGTDFKVGSSKFAGFVPYIEFTKFSMQGRDVYLQSTNTVYSPMKNTGYVILTGIRVIF